MQGISKACSPCNYIQHRKTRAERLLSKRNGASSVITHAFRTDAARIEGPAKVYVALTPLVGMEMIESLATAAGRQLPEAIALHTVVVVHEQGEEVSPGVFIIYFVIDLKHFRGMMSFLRYHAYCMDPCQINTVTYSCSVTTSCSDSR